MGSASVSKQPAPPSTPRLGRPHWLSPMGGRAFLRRQQPALPQQQLQHTQQGQRPARHNDEASQESAGLFVTRAVYTPRAAAPKVGLANGRSLLLGVAGLSSFSTS